MSGHLMVMGVRPTDPPDVQATERAVAALLAVAGTDPAVVNRVWVLAGLACRWARELADVHAALDADRVPRIRTLPGHRDAFDGELTAAGRLALGRAQWRTRAEDAENRAASLEGELADVTTELRRAL